MRFSFVSNLAFDYLTAIAVFLLVLCFNLGCEQPPTIVQHKVHKSRSGLDALRESKQPSFPVQQAPVGTTKTRMFVAIFDNPDKTWFFKVNGPVEQVNATEDQWLSFLDSVKFEAGEPKWSAPDQWSTAGPKPMRFATLVIRDSDEESKPPKSKPLELAVSNLGPNQNMLLNVNRWRGQLGLDKLTQEQLGDHLKTKKTEHGEYLYYDGQGTGSGTMRPPLAGGGFHGGKAPFVGGSPMGRGAPAMRALKFTAPEGWSAGKTSSMVQARFSKTDGEAKAQITVTEMPADANQWMPNIKRWAGQVGLDQLTDQQLTTRTSEIKVDEVAGKLVDLAADSEAEQGVIAAMVKRKGSAWFFKLSGDRGLVDQSREEFEAFMETVRYQ